MKTGKRLPIKRHFNSQCDLKEERPDLLFSMNDLGFSYIRGRMHFRKPLSGEREWKPCIRIAKPRASLTPSAEKVTLVPSQRNSLPLRIHGWKSIRNKRRTPVPKVFDSIDQTEVRDLEKWETTVLQRENLMQKYQRFKIERTRNNYNSTNPYLSASLM